MSKLNDRVKTLSAAEAIDHYLTVYNLTLPDFTSPAEAIEALLRYERDVERHFTREETLNEIGEKILQLHEKHKKVHNYYLYLYNELFGSTADKN